nr:TIR domain-containing protein [Leptolyngbyaceae cyanobacterium MO_188.B28]
MSASPLVKTILILAANPRGTTTLRLDEEVREIEEGLRRGQQRDRFVLKQRWATRALDIHRAILYETPQIVHFCGNASTEGLVLEDEFGCAAPVSCDALAGLFRVFSDEVECVLLNTCYCQAQAEAISRHIRTVIGINQAVGDKTSIHFAVGFYDALGAGRDMVDAYQLGCTTIEMASADKAIKPILLRSSSLVNQEFEDSS